MEASRDEEWDGYPLLPDIQTKDEPAQKERNQPEVAN